jgi:hypothetical protein
MLHAPLWISIALAVVLTPRGLFLNGYAAGDLPRTAASAAIGSGS